MLKIQNGGYPLWKKKKTKTLIVSTASKIPVIALPTIFSFIFRIGDRRFPIE
jgi:hypothetical protein